MMTPSPETCKRLTEYLGECWHEDVKQKPLSKEKIDSGYIQVALCSCGKGSCFHPNHTFTTPADLFAVYSKMVERGEWADFEDCADREYILLTRSREAYQQNPRFNPWLFCLNAPDQIGERMEMAARFLKEK